VSVAHAILGALMEAPAHGYSIKKYLAAALTDELNDGQLYPALARMEREGWIQKQVVRQRSSPTKHLYRITEAGRREFLDWLAGAGAPSGSPRMDLFSRFEFLQRCAFFRHIDPASVEELVGVQLERAERCLARLERLCEELRAGAPDPYREMVLEYGIRVQRMRREWLRELLARAAARQEKASSPRVAGAPQA
jgi:DNA-binding PadR family transcriptional regulator